MKYNYTEGELKALLKSMKVVIDTREEQNKHILEYLEKKKVEVINKKMDFGDYSFMIPQNTDLAIERDLYFFNDIVIERKFSLGELSNNLTKDRTRFESELLRKKDAKFILMVENGSWEKIKAKMYTSEYKPQSYLATLYSYMARYNIQINFVTKDFAPEFILNTFFYHAREILKNGGLKNGL